MILFLPFLIAGIAISWVFGIKPFIEKSRNHEKVIEEYYEEYKN